MSPAELRRLLDAGRHREAAEALHTAHGAEVERFVRARLGRGADPADVCQEVWAAAARGLPGFRQQSEPRAWVLAIARHKTLDAWRRRRAPDTLDPDVVTGGPLGALLGLRRVTTPTGALERRTRAQALRRALAQLDEEQRELLELRFVLDLKPAEIAAMLGGVSANTVSQRIVRAAKRLREALSSEGVFTPS